MDLQAPYVISYAAIPDRLITCCHSTDRLYLLLLPTDFTCCHIRKTLGAATSDRLWMLSLPTDFGCCHSRQTFYPTAPSLAQLPSLSYHALPQYGQTRSTPVGSTTSFGSMFETILISIIGIYYHSWDANTTQKVTHSRLTPGIVALSDTHLPEQIT